MGGFKCDMNNKICEYVKSEILHEKKSNSDDDFDPIPM
jgi:hypothetical protein